MKRAHVINVLKLLVVAALMMFVFANVQWVDSYIEIGDDQEIARELQGEIIGPWDQPEVRFQPQDDTGQPFGEELLVDQGDGSRKVSPGFGTFILNLDWLLFFAGALCYFITVNVAGTRWWWLLRVNQLNVPWWTAVRYTWIGLFFNNVVPGQTGGDVIKAIYIVKHCEGGRLSALVSVLVDRVLGLGSLALLGAMVVLFALDRDGFDTIAYAIWGVLLVVALVGVAAFSKRIRRGIRLGGLLNRLPAGISGMLKRVDQAVHFYRGHSTVILIWVLIGVANHALSVSSTMLIGQALGVGMPPLEYFVLVPIINILSAFPIGPNGWGVGEVAYRYLFGSFGAAHLDGIPRATASFIMGTRGVALSILFRLHMTLWSLVGGLVVLFERDRVTMQDIEDEVALEAEEAEEARHDGPADGP